MEWVLIITLFSTHDVFLQGHTSYKECIHALKQFKRTHKKDTDINKLECEKAVVLNEELIITKSSPDL
jgi:hypothetical protein